jgi:hypothetical protein
MPPAAKLHRMMPSLAESLPLLGISVSKTTPSRSEPKEAVARPKGPRTVDYNGETAGNLAGEDAN